MFVTLIFRKTGNIPKSCVQNAEKILKSRSGARMTPEQVKEAIQLQQEIDEIEARKIMLADLGSEEER